MSEVDGRPGRPTHGSLARASQEEVEAMIARAPIDMELKRRMRDQVRMP